MAGNSAAQEQKIEGTSSTTTGLTPEQIRQFKEEGFLIVRQMLPLDAFQPLIDELAQKVDRAIGEAVRQGQLDCKKTIEDAPFANRLALASEACTDRNWLWQNYFSRGKPISAGMFTLRTTPVLLDATESLIGPEILAHPQFALRPKMPDLDLMDIPWHQDLAYLIPDEAGETLVVNYWIPLVSATEQNGCMQVIPGSHLEGLIEHDLWIETPGHKGARGIADSDLPASSVVSCEVDPGDVLITMERLVHRSIPNRSQTVRWSVDTRYSRIGLPTGRSKVPGFVARSRRHPDRVARSHHDWIQNLADAGLDRWLQPLQN
ncbi:MAG: phytanoyl-CoA dioxygenase family protein [Caldilineaceae bacterium]|nr:phytanoyl-CoA dioxygenase family protein [Caldilineaceae bacterium]